MIRPALALAALVGLSACASTADRGWTGENAAPFAGAEQTCRNEANIATEDAAPAVFEACMARFGWRRPLPK